MGKPMPSSGVWKMKKVAVWPVFILPIRVSSITTSAWQPRPERDLDPHQPRLLVGGLEHQHGDTDIGAVLSDDALEQGALFGLGARRRFAADLPVAMHRLYRALGEGVCMEPDNGREHGREQDRQKRDRACTPAAHRDGRGNGRPDLTSNDHLLSP